MSTPYARGIDVFHGDGKIDWAAVLADGYSFGFCKATDGLGAPDAQLAANWAAMGECGITRGAYHFLHPNLDGAQQAAHFVAAMKAVGGMPDPIKLPVMDLEINGGQGYATIVACGKAFVQGVAAGLGISTSEVTVYMSPGFASSFPDGGKLLGHTFGVGGLGCRLWIAHYTNAAQPIIPFGWSKWDFWQFAMAEWKSDADGPRPLQPDGCVTAVDSNRFNGTHADLVSRFGIN